MLARLGEWFHWSRAELEALTWPDALFWFGAVAALIEKRSTG